jgi:hypothetical protein
MKFKATRARARAYGAFSGRDAKIWLEPEIAIADSYGFNSRALSVSDNRDLILKAWDDNFGN